MVRAIGRLIGVQILRSSAYCPCDGMIDLLVSVDEFLQSSQSRGRRLEEVVNDCRNSMVRAPNAGYCQTTFLVQLEYWYRLSTTHLDRRDVESEHTAPLVRATHMERVLARRKLASDSRVPGLRAEFARYLELFLSNEAHAFGIVEMFCVAKFDLFRPHSTVDMHPIIPGCAFQWLAWVYRPPCCKLFLAPSFASFLYHFALGTLLFSFPVRFFLVGHLGRLHELLWGSSDGT